MPTLVSQRLLMGKQMFKTTDWSTDNKGPVNWGSMNF